MAKEKENKTASVIIFLAAAILLLGIKTASVIIFLAAAILLLGILSVGYEYKDKEYNAYIMNGGTMSSEIDTLTKEHINYTTIWYYKPDLRYDSKVGNYYTEEPLRRLIKDIPDVKINEQYPQTKIIEHQNVLGGTVRVSLIIGRDIEIKERSGITTIK